jgi:transaldolase
VDRPNLFVKIPAVKQGLPAISACLAEGISINVTLIFSLARYAEVIEAFLTGLEGARAASRDLSGIASEVAGGSRRRATAPAVGPD